MQKIITLLATVSVLSACATPPKSTAPNPQAARVANPASLNCIQNNGRLEIQRLPDGSERADCILPDGKRCDEWEMFRGNCPTRTVNVGLSKFGM